MPCSSKCKTGKVFGRLLEVTKHLHNLPAAKMHQGTPGAQEKPGNVTYAQMSERPQRGETVLSESQYNEFSCLK